MGREIRRVPPNWKHPTRMVPNHRLGRLEEDFQPLYDKDAETAWEEWYADYQAWIGGGFASVLADHPGAYNAAEPYRSFCDYHGSPPDVRSYRPKWDNATWFQVYETVSEGTPVTPPFATEEELVDYLVQNGDFWDQRRGSGGWKRENAESFVRSRWAPSMMIERTAAGTTIKEPRDGI